MHLLILERFAGILTSARAAERSVRDRDAVRRFETAEIPPLHRTRETAANCDAGHVDLLTRHEVMGLNKVSDFEQVLRIDAEFRELLLGLDFGFRKIAAIYFRKALGFGKTGAELHGAVAVPFVCSC